MKTWISYRNLKQGLPRQQQSELSDTSFVSRADLRKWRKKLNNSKYHLPCNVPPALTSNVTVMTAGHCGRPDGCSGWRHHLIRAAAAPSHRRLQHLHITGEKLSKGGSLTTATRLFRGRARTRQANAPFSCTCSVLPLSHENHLHHGHPRS